MRLSSEFFLVSQGCSVLCKEFLRPVLKYHWHSRPEIREGRKLVRQHALEMQLELLPFLTCQPQV